MTELVGQLVSELGVDEKQASGGAGLLFKLAQEKLSAGDFSKVTESLPGVSELVGQAPDLKGAGGGASGLVGSAMSALGGGSMGNLGALATAATAFKGLGMDAGMVTKFAPVVMNFAQKHGGDVVKNLLEKAVMKG